MAQDSGFFNAEYQDGEYDRVYNAEQFAAYFSSFIGNGIFGNTMDELLPTAANPNNMSINILSGRAWINGWWYLNDETYNMPIALADGVLSRKDIVVVRWGNAERRVWLEVIQGEPSLEAVAPTIRRDADYYDLKLCEIDIPAGTSKITQAQITDTRLVNSVCGLVTGLVDQIDTTALFIQFQAAYADWKNTQEADFEDWSEEQKEDFDSWYDAIKDVISESTAYNIFGMITENVEVQTQVSKTYAADDLVIYQEELREVTSTVPQGSALNDNNSHKIALSTLINRIYTSFSNALTSLKNTAIAQAVGATGSTFTSVIAKLAEIVNRGKVTKTLDVSTTSFTIAQGYHDGTGSVNIVTQEKSVAPTASSQDITPDSGKVLSKVVVNAVSTQEKAVTAGTSTVTVEPDSGKLLSRVTVSPTPSETKTQAAGTSNIDVTPTSGKLLSKVTVTPTPSQSKSASPSTSAQTITPDSGKLLSSVSVSAISPVIGWEGATITDGGIDNDKPYVWVPYGYHIDGNNGRNPIFISENTLQSIHRHTQQGYLDSNGNHDIGVYHGYRYITVNVPNSNSGTYSVTSNGTKDMGATNSYRYISVSVPSNIGSLIYNNHAQWTSTDNAGKTLSWTATQRCFVFGHITNTRFNTTEISISVSGLNGLRDYTYQCPTRGGTNVYTREWIGCAVVSAGTTVSLTGTTYSFFDSGSTVYIQLCAYAL